MGDASGGTSFGAERPLTLGFSISWSGYSAGFWYSMWSSRAGWCYG